MKKLDNSMFFRSFFSCCFYVCFHCISEPIVLVNKRNDAGQISMQKRWLGMFNAT